MILLSETNHLIEFKRECSAIEFSMMELYSSRMDKGSLYETGYQQVTVFRLFPGKEKARRSSRRLPDASCFIPELIVATNALCRHKRRLYLSA